MPIVSKVAPPAPSYTTAWKITGQQQDLLTCLAISPNGEHLVVASEDRTLLLIDVKYGYILVKISFEDQFWVLCALWYCNWNVIVGCSNGSLYEICFKPTNNQYRVTMSPFLTPFNHQVRSLSFDPTQFLLAVGHGSTVELFSYLDSTNSTDQSPQPEWEHFEVIKGPSNNESGLVNALLFYPTDENSQNLLIGYAEAGFGVWSGLASIKRISRVLNENVCRIGRATLAADKKSLAVSTLDRTITTYRLGIDGPILGSMKVFPYEDDADYSPIVPVASTPDGLMLGGTTRGEVPMVQGSKGDVSLIQHEEAHHLIRVIETHGQNIIVGSSCWADSTLKCYRLSAVCPSKKNPGDPILVTVTQALKGWESTDSRWGDIKLTNVGRRASIKRVTWFWVVGATMIIIILVLSADPPSGSSFEDATQESLETDVLKPNFKQHEYWVLFGVRHFMKYTRFQFLVWGTWVIRSAYEFVEGVAQVLPEAANIVMLGAAKWMCERVKVYRELGVCPKLEY
ncbi:hypothetical protein FRC12_020409 [Ceratobasidium sp. 428]|nr:hypothetical protein FRC12_020409 [Ceratobasidium sp. 428]